MAWVRESCGVNRSERESRGCPGGGETRADMWARGGEVASKWLCAGHASTTVHTDTPGFSLDTPGQL